MEAQGEHEHVMAIACGPPRGLSKITSIFTSIVDRFVMENASTMEEHNKKQKKTTKEKTKKTTKQIHNIARDICEFRFESIGFPQTCAHWNRDFKGCL